MRQRRVKWLAEMAMNAVMVVAIVGIITGTWLPAIYISHWFQNSQWVRVHLLHYH